MDSYNFRAAALLAARIFLTTVLMVPLVSVINRVFRGTWAVNWRLMLSVYAVLVSLGLAFWLVTQFLERVTTEDRARNGVLVFPAAIWLRGVYLVGILLGITIIVGMYREGDRGLILATPSFLILIGFFAWPRAIRISNGEVRQRGALFGTKRIPFKEIEQIVSDEFSGEIVVFAKNGTNIVHTAMHIQQKEFIHQLKHLSRGRVNSVGELAPD